MFPSVEIGGCGLSTWRLVVVSAVVFCWFLLIKRTRRLGYPTVPVLIFLVIELPVGTIGSSLFNRLIPFVFGLKGLELDGLTVIGSIVAALAFGAVYLKRVLKTPPLPLLDAAAFTLPLAIGLGRFGCLLNGCCFGTLAPDWAKASVLRVFTIPAGLYSPLSYAGQTLKATPGDSLLWNLPVMLMLHELGVLIVAETLYRRRERWRLPPGTVLAAAVAQESGGRFFLEYLRWDQLVPGTALNPWQLSVALLFLVSFALLSVQLARRDGVAADGASI